MEAQLFYWTGVVVWWAVCLGVILSVIAASIIAPMVVFKRVRGTWWRWLTFSKFVSTGWTQEQLLLITRHARIYDQDWIRTAKLVLEKAEELKEL